MSPPRSVPEWNEYFINVALDVAKRSKDPSTQHGSVIVDEKHRIISTGYNGGCRKIPDDLIDWERPNKYSWVIHSEENALWMANRHDLEGCTLYVTGPPCSDCMLRIAHAGIENIVYGCQKSKCVDEEDWILGLKIAELANVKLTEFTF